jgi:hypothetical protein
MFLEINPLSLKAETGDAELLDMILHELGYVPLAVQLFAHVSRGHPLQYMCNRWMEKRTAMLAHGAKPDKLESFEVSITLSLAAPDISNTPEAVQLLSMLCQLPDGLHMWEERLPIIGARFQYVYFLFSLLHDAALVFMERNWLKVLSPIRHFVTQNHPSSDAHTQELEACFWSLVQTYASREPGPDFVDAVRILEPDMGNIGILVTNAVQRQPSPQVVEIILNVLRVLKW